MLPPLDEERRVEAACGLLLGTAVADAIGLPREGLSARRAARIFGEAPLEHALVLRRGMISDDTEHATMVAQALLSSGGDHARFVRSLGWRFRGWVLALPAGVGLATLRAIVRLWLGWSPTRSGVLSAGNGAAMRAPVIGIYASDDPELIVTLVSACTHITHRDPRAREGAIAVALAACCAGQSGRGAIDVPEIFAEILPRIEDAELLENLRAILPALTSGLSAKEYATSLGQADAVSGFVNHTVPVALYCWLRHSDDFRAAVESAVLLGGDTDTVAAITGAMAGANLGVEGIPESWRSGLLEAPRSVRWLDALGRRLGSVAPGEPARPQPLNVLWLPLRNLFFLAIVLLHGFRRLVPPY